MSTITEVVEFAESKRPGIKAGLIPATMQDVERYSVLSQGVIPQQYLEMLRLMGMSCGELEIAHAVFDIQQLNARYNVLAPQLDKRYALVAIDCGEMYLDYYIDRAEGDLYDAPVVRFDYEVDDPEIFAMYGSLYEWLYSVIFKRFALEQHKHIIEKVISTEKDQELLTTLCGSLASLGFVSPLDDTPLLCAACRSHASVIVRQHPTDEFVVLGIGADDQREMNEIHEVLMKEIGL